MRNGSCHCGAVRFSVKGEPLQAMECNCSHCSRKGFLLWFVPGADMELISGEAELSTYTFNKHVIAHRFCSVCGCQPFGFGNADDGSVLVAINVRCLDDNDLDQLERVPVNGRAF